MGESIATAIRDIRLSAVRSAQYSVRLLMVISKPAHFHDVGGMCNGLVCLCVIHLGSLRHSCTEL
jgi:hypothetical protein